MSSRAFDRGIWYATCWNRLYRNFSIQPTHSRQCTVCFKHLEKCIFKPIIFLHVKLDRLPFEVISFVQSIKLKLVHTHISPKKSSTKYAAHLSFCFPYIFVMQIQSQRVNSRDIFVPTLPKEINLGTAPLRDSQQQYVQ